MKIDVQRIIDSSIMLFHDVGYKNTNISNVAKQAAVATGSIYNFFSSKKALLYYSVLYCLDGNLDSISFPVEHIDESKVLELFKLRYSDFINLINPKHTGKYMSFESLIETIFDFTYQYHIGFNIINYNGTAMNLVKEEYDQSVIDFHSIIEDYVSYYIDKEIFRPIDLPELHVHNISEGIIWWTMHLPRVNGNTNIDNERLKKIAVDTLSHAYLKK